MSSVSIVNNLAIKQYSRQPDSAGLKNTAAAKAPLATANTTRTGSSIVSISSSGYRLSNALASSLQSATKPVSPSAAAASNAVSPARLNFGSVDTVAPTVSQFSPADGTSGAAASANIVLTFSESIKRGTGSIVLKDTNGATIETFDAANSNRISISGNTLTINPTNDLAYNTRYFVTFAAGTVRDLAGNKYAGTSSYDFKTAPDPLPPTVTGFSPADGASSASRSANIVLTFSEAIQRGTGAIVLKDANGAIIETFDAANSSRIAISGNTLTLDPSNDLAYNTRYFVTFANGTVRDLTGNKYAGISTYDFRTVTDNAAPTVTGFSPADGAGNVSRSANVALTFSEAIQRGSGAIVLKDANGAIVESFDAASSARLSISGNTLTLNPTSDLAFNAKYFVTFALGTVRDLAGNRYAGTSTYDFRTVADTLAPTVTGFAPANGAAGASRSANIVLSFSEAIQRGSGTILLKEANGTVVESFDAAGSDRISIAGNTLTLNPTSDLAYNTRYFATFAAGTVRDIAGNKYAGTSTYAFRTLADTIAPTVTTFSPADGANGASRSTNIAVTFSEAIQRGLGSIVLKDAAGAIIESFDAASSDRITISGNSLTLDPSSDLADNTQYFVTFAAGTIRDLAGNSYAGTNTYDFRTVADIATPSVTHFSPADGATGASRSANIALTFSEAIQRGTGNIVLKKLDGTIVESFDAASSNRLSVSGNTLTLDPTNDLVANTQYLVTFAAGSIKDLADNNYAGTSSYGFRTAPGAFNIDVVYSGDPSYQSYFDQAKAVWEQVITGDLANVGGTDDLRIAASVTNIDGAGGILGQASPDSVRSGSNLPYQGHMQFDSADLATMVQNGTLLKIITHEMGHVLGIGSLWSTFGLNATVGRYTGTNALNMYRTMAGGNPNATYVPLETVGGAGTVNVHWSEAVFDTELMTGYAESNHNMPLSKLSIAALADLGYQVDYNAADA